MFDWVLNTYLEIILSKALSGCFFLLYFMRGQWNNRLFLRMLIRKISKGHVELCQTSKIEVLSKISLEIMWEKADEMKQCSSCTMDNIYNPIG